MRLDNSLIIKKYKQKLFSKQIDFDNNSVIDGVNGYNASLVGRFHYWNVKTTRSLQLTTPVNPNLDFCITCNLAQIDSVTDLRYIIGHTTTIGLRQSATNQLILYINGSARLTVATTRVINVSYLYTLKRDSNIFSIILDSYVLGTFDASALTIAQNIEYVMSEGVSSNTSAHNCAIFTESRLNSEIQTINKFNYSLLNY